ncbi:MAG: alpha/beta hydrolase [Propionibacteriaceae bacterium]|jgi:pimeloyl-ACP methyl ester carboxylesterase|nr:alpha/beta hydrolase [Propionibacteriaceae bacterium]
MDLPLMIFLHGPGQAPPVWQDVVTQINPAQPMVAPWLKGLKPTEHAGFDMAEAVGSILDLMEARGAAQADLIGFSLGGLVALRAAAMYPEKINHLVLVSTPVVPSQRDLAKQKTVVKLMPSYMFKSVPKEQVLAGLDALMAAGLSAEVDNVTTPTLVIAGEKDSLGKVSAEVFRNHIGAQVRLVPGADADLLKVAPQQVAQLTSDFIAGFLDDETESDDSQIHEDPQEGSTR